MDKIVTTFLSSDRAEVTEKIAVDGWLRITASGVEQTGDVTIPVIERKAAIRAAAWMETHTDATHLPGLHYWGDLDADFSDDNGIGYIHSGYKGKKKFPKPTVGWALLKVRNGEWFLDKPKQHYLDGENIEETTEAWFAKMDYVDALTKGKSLFVWIGRPENKTDISPYIIAVLENISKEPVERAEEKRHRIVGKDLRQTNYRMMKALKPETGMDTELVLDTEPESPQTAKLPAKVIGKDGTTVTIDLARIQDSMVQFDLMEDGKLVTGYRMIWSTNEGAAFETGRQRFLKYVHNPRYTLKGDVNPDWVVESL